MTLDRLIDDLTELRDQLREHELEPKLMAAHQPSWPLAVGVSRVALTVETDNENNLRPVIWIVVSGSSHSLSPYAPREVFDEGGGLEPHEAKEIILQEDQPDEEEEPCDENSTDPKP